MADKRFIRWAKASLVMIYLVIVAGAVVRMTGSGMGCPDWPKCFGMWVPPTDVSQLPANYQEIYSERGYADTTFNAFHTWTEYGNRLIGALSGFVIIIMTFFAFKIRQQNPKLLWYCLAIFIAIGFQGWLGKVVVDSVLAPVKITIHMIMALILAAMLISLIVYASPKQQGATMPSSFKALLWVAILLTLVQVAFGTQVRQQIDAIASRLQYQQRETWIDQLSIIFKVHRSFSLLVLALNAYLFVKARQRNATSTAANWVMILLGIEIVTGIIMAYLGIPFYIQPIHLVLASIIFGLQLYWVLSLQSWKTERS